MYYAAYGSNMSQKQMALRCPNSVLIGAGFLHGHRLYFGSWANTWGGAVADVSETDEASNAVPVLVYELPGADLKLLDRFEGYPTKYRRKQAIVAMRNGKRVKAWVYFLSDDHQGQFGTPSAKYFDQIKRAYMRFKFNVGYLERAEKVSMELENKQALELEHHSTVPTTETSEEPSYPTTNVDDIFSEFED